MKILNLLVVAAIAYWAFDAEARRCEQGIQEIPISISAITDEELKTSVDSLPQGACALITVDLAPNGNNVVGVDSGLIGGNSYLNNIDVERIEVVRGPQARLFGKKIVFELQKANPDAIKRFANIVNVSELAVEGVTIRGWGSNTDGGAILVQNKARFEAYQSSFEYNETEFFGGAIAATGEAHIDVSESLFEGNGAGLYGGGVSLLGSATGLIQRSEFYSNISLNFGRDIHVETNAIYRYRSGLVLDGNQFTGDDQIPSQELSFGSVMSHNSAFIQDDTAINALAKKYAYGSVYARYSKEFRRQQTRDSDPKPEVICDDSGTGAIESLGYNAASDSSCNLTEPSDLQGIDLMLAENESGIWEPQAGSPLIDSGQTDAMVFEGETLASLPCSYKDLNGIGRPQDANDDGVFECDRGAVEYPGPGLIVVGHSAAFFNALRDGEGQYVEIVNETTAVVYTFSHRPDGSGPAWFIGVGTIVGNSIVIDQLLQPNGTSFGDDFDSSEIEISFAGGQSMVFNDCEAAAPGGNVAFSGNKDLGYEALITRAQRLSNILGCGAETPHPNAGLSGSYFLPSRDGEGIVVQWLPNGDVLVVFFTYDENDNQMWVIGIGKADGNSVTMNALYASTSTKWGSEFDAAEVTLSNWGTFELIWTECDGVQFKYVSTVGTYGSATRQYVRLSRLLGTSCPSF